MGLVAWLTGIASGAVAEARETTRPAEAPLPPHLAQQQRIFRKAEQYRRQLRAEAVARAAREAEQERARLQRAQDEFEDEQARALALGRGYFPGDTEQEREPLVTFTPLDGSAGESGGEAGPLYGWFRFPR